MLRGRCVGLAVAGKVDVVDRDRIGDRRLAGSYGPQQLLIADIGTVLQSNPAMRKARALTAHIFSDILKKYERMSQ